MGDPFVVLDTILYCKQDVFFLSTYLPISETCSGNNYLTSNNGCASCGGNSISNGTDCICDKSFIRFLHQRYDYSTQCYREFFTITIFLTT